jgi:hypothetical protein
MNAERFNKLVEDQLNRCKATMVKKNDEYSSEIDRLHNFKVAARINSPEATTPEEALLGMYRKHIVSTLDIIENAKFGDLPSTGLLNEKIGDSINYLLLLQALVTERIEDHADAINQMQSESTDSTPCEFEPYP